MTSTTEQPVEHADLARFGYTQELHRRVGSFASFAAGFSYVSILTTVFQLFFLGFGFGGAAFFWTWPVVFAGQLLVALNFSTLAARFPISGAIYQWSSRLAGQTFGWFTGWVMIIGQILTVAAAAIALQAVLPSIWSGFQLLGGDSSPTSASGAQNAVLLGVILLVVTTAVNIIGIRLMAIISSTGVVLEILGVIAIVITLFAHTKRGPSVVLHATGATPTPGSPYIWAWLASGLMAAYVMVGFDSAGELSEETHAPRRITPRTIIRALVVSGIGGGLLLIAALMAAPSLTDGNLATVGLPYVVESVFGATAGRIILVDVIDRDHRLHAGLPDFRRADDVLDGQAEGAAVPRRPRQGLAAHRHADRHLACRRRRRRPGPRRQPRAERRVHRAVQPVHRHAVHRLPGRHRRRCCCTGSGTPAARRAPPPPRGPTSTASGCSASASGPSRSPSSRSSTRSLAIINLAWPRKSVYDLTGHTWWLQWSAVLFIAVTLVVGYLVHLRLRGGKVHIPHAWHHHHAAEPAAVALAEPEGA